MTEVYQQGFMLDRDHPQFWDGLRAAIDYRGDTTIFLKDGTLVEGFLFNLKDRELQLFPANSSDMRCVSLDELSSIEFSGKDTAKGKSWEDWLKKKEAAKKRAS